jgi:hypothetical protein
VGVMQTEKFATDAAIGELNYSNEFKGGCVAHGAGFEPTTPSKAHLVLGRLPRRR